VIIAALEALGVVAAVIAGFAFIAAGFVWRMEARERRARELAAARRLGTCPCILSARPPVFSPTCPLHGGWYE